MAILLFLVFVVLPIAELYVIIQVGSWIGVLPTLGLLLLDGILGAWLAATQGRQAWERFNQAMAEGRIPAREVADGAMIIFGGALLLSPGFITDILGIILLIPPTRALMRWLMTWLAARTPAGRPVFFAYKAGSVFDGARRRRRPSGPPPGAGPSPGPSSAGPSDPGAASDPFGAARPRRDYDLDGTAREINDSEGGLPDRAGSARDDESGSRDG